MNDIRGKLFTVVDVGGNTWELEGVTRTFTPYNPPIDRLYGVAKGTEFPIHLFSKRKNGRWVLKGKPQNARPYIVDCGELLT